MKHELINPEILGKPRGYSNGVLAAQGRLLFVAGQIGWDASQKIVGPGFSAQFKQALANAIAVVTAAGGKAEHICRMTIYVSDKAEYIAAAKAIGVEYRRLMGDHYPAMSLVEVKALLEPGAVLEIEVTAVIP